MWSRPKIICEPYRSATFLIIKPEETVVEWGKPKPFWENKTENDTSLPGNLREVTCKCWRNASRSRLIGHLKKLSIEENAVWAGFAIMKMQFQFTNFKAAFRKRKNVSRLNRELNSVKPRAVSDFIKKAELARVL